MAVMHMSTLHVFCLMDGGLAGIRSEFKLSYPSSDSIVPSLYGNGVLTSLRIMQLLARDHRTMQGNVSDDDVRRKKQKFSVCFN